MPQLVKTGLLVVSLSLAASACGGSSKPAASGTASNAPSAASSAATSGAPAAASGAFYVFLPKSLNNPYWVDAKKGMDAESAKLGVKAEFLGPAEDDAAKQVAIFESVLSRKPAGIAISPNDAGSVKDLVSKARAAGIPVLAWDGPVPGSEVQGYVGTNNVEAGKKEGEALAASIGNKGKVAIVIGSLSAPNLKQRLEGLKTALKAFPDIKVVATEESNESVATAQTKAESILQAHPDLAGFAGIGGSDLPGIAGALKSNGGCGRIKAVGFDVVPQGIAGMKAGCVQALVSQKPYGMTAKALDLLIDLHGGKPLASNNVDTGVVVVDKSGLAAFLTSPH